MYHHFEVGYLNFAFIRHKQNLKNCKTLCLLFSPGYVPMSITMLPEKPNSSHIPDVTKTGILSSICIKFSFSKRKLSEIALETSESLIGFPAAFEDYFAMTEICTCSASVIIGHALGLV